MDPSPGRGSIRSGKRGRSRSRSSSRDRSWKRREKSGRCGEPIISLAEKKNRHVNLSIELKDCRSRLMVFRLNNDRLLQELKDWYPTVHLNVDGGKPEITFNGPASDVRRAILKLFEKFRSRYGIWYEDYEYIKDLDRMLATWVITQIEFSEEDRAKEKEIIEMNIKYSEQKELCSEGSGDGDTGDHQRCKRYKDLEDKCTLQNNVIKKLNRANQDKEKSIQDREKTIQDLKVKVQQQESERATLKFDLELKKETVEKEIKEIKAKLESEKKEVLFNIDKEKQDEDYEEVSRVVGETCDFEHNNNEKGSSEEKYENLQNSFKILSEENKKLKKSNSELKEEVQQEKSEKGNLKAEYELKNNKLRTDQQEKAKYINELEEEKDKLKAEYEAKLVSEKKSMGAEIESIKKEMKKELVEEKDNIKAEYEAKLESGKKTMGAEIESMKKEMKKARLQSERKKYWW